MSDFIKYAFATYALVALGSAAAMMVSMLRARGRMLDGKRASVLVLVALAFGAALFWPLFGVVWTVKKLAPKRAAPEFQFVDQAKMTEDIRRGVAIRAAEKVRRLRERKVKS